MPPRGWFSIRQRLGPAMPDLLGGLLSIVNTALVHRVGRRYDGVPQGLEAIKHAFQ